ncbi:MAG TPA: hypothetical protein VGV38_15445 [Pyrinomonadaceae bacterium]|nr:hypothetical protein [Pyrinomonadaceae bacterium]
MLRVLDEGDERAQGKHLALGRVLQDQPAAPPDDERDADRADEVNEREEDGVVKNRVNVRAPVVVVDVGELAEADRLAVENLHGLRARDVLLQEGVDARQLRANQVVAAPRVLAEPCRRREQERHGDERDERQTPVHPEHDGDDGGNHHHVAEHVYHAGGEQFV